jgi:hypothetical protein
MQKNAMLCSSIYLSVRSTKNGEEDATFCLLKDGTFFFLFLSKQPGTGFLQRENQK